MKNPKATRRVPHRRLTEMRINAGMSPNDLALRAGVTGKTIRMAEAGFIPSPRTQFSIARVFDMQPTDLWRLEHSGAQAVAA